MISGAIVLALRALERNVLRSALTILGIVIGVGAVIAMVTLGNGTSAKVLSGISNLGSNLLEVMPGQMSRGGAFGAARMFTAADVAAIAEQVPGVQTVAPITSRQILAVAGASNWNTQLIGTDNGYFDALQRPFAVGRPFSDSELRSGGAVCVLGKTAGDRLFGDTDALGQTLRLQRVACRVVGVLAEKGNTLGQNQDDMILMPLHTFQRRVSGNTDVLAVLLSAAEGVSTARVKHDIELLLRERRRIQGWQEDDFSVLDVSQLGETFASTTTLLTGFLAAVAAVSLLVGGIGIMNIMLVSVTERTREIGIRLAIGALRNQVLAQFLVESVVLSLIGGVIGVAVGLSIAGVATRYLDVPFLLDPTIVALAFGFSAAVGVVFGFFPARRAANLDPIEALRHE